MDQVAFKMKLRPGAKQEYIKRHGAIWPEIVALLQLRGVYDYSIFFDAETDTLFAVHKTNNTSKGTVTDAAEILQRWWDHMADLMEVNTDNSPVIKPLEQVFYLQ